MGGGGNPAPFLRLKTCRVSGRRFCLKPLLRMSNQRKCGFPTLRLNLLFFRMGPRQMDSHVAFFLKKTETFSSPPLVCWCGNFRASLEGSGTPRRRKSQDAIPSSRGTRGRSSTPGSSLIAFTRDTTCCSFTCKTASGVFPLPAPVPKGEKERFVSVLRQSGPASRHPGSCFGRLP